MNVEVRRVWPTRAGTKETARLVGDMVATIVSFSASLRRVVWSKLAAREESAQLVDGGGCSQSFPSVLPPEECKQVVVNFGHN